MSAQARAEEGACDFNLCISLSFFKHLALSQAGTHTHTRTHKTLANANSIMLQERKVEEEEEEEADPPACPHAEPEQTL